METLKPVADDRTNLEVDGTLKEIYDSLTTDPATNPGALLFHIEGTDINISREQLGGEFAMMAILLMNSAVKNDDFRT